MVGLLVDVPTAGVQVECYLQFVRSTHIEAPAECSDVAARSVDTDGEQVSDAAFPELLDQTEADGARNLTSSAIPRDECRACTGSVLSVDHDAVGGNLLAGPDLHPVARLYVLDGHLALGAVVDERRRTIGRLGPGGDPTPSALW